MIKIDKTANEQGTIGIIIDFADDDGAAAIPATLSWSLTDASGNVINGRDRVQIPSPAASNTIVLQGDDLQILSSETARKIVARRIVVEATYDSTLGSNLPANEVATFPLENLTKIS